MNIEAKRELAQAYNRAVRLHEASYERRYVGPLLRHVYTLSWHEAAEQACQDKELVPLVYAMAAGGYSDYADWAAQFSPQTI